MKHYVCPGSCGAVSKEPGTCMAEYCEYFHKDFVPCDCADGKHAGVIKACKNCGKICKGTCDVEVYKPELK